jgi:fibronectin-binding autotransporter adhesin
MDLPGADNSITTIGSGVTVILEDSGTIKEIGTNLATVSGTFRVEGTTNFTTGAGGLALSGGTLAGTGAVTGNVTSTGGTVQPGSTPGTLTLTGNLLLDATSLLDFDLDIAGVVGGGVNDLLVVNGALTLDGSLDVADLGGFGLGTYRLINYTGSLTDLGLDIGSMPSADFAYGIDTSTPGQVNLTVAPLVVVPEPAAAVLAALGVLGVALRRRR